MGLAPVPLASLITAARQDFHAALLGSILTRDSSTGIVSVADKDSVASVNIADGMLNGIGAHIQIARLKGQSSGSKFEEIVADYLEKVFPKLDMLRPGKFRFGGKAVARGQRKGTAISAFDQYSHLASLEAAAQADPKIAIAIGQDYLIKPDVTIIRDPEPDQDINRTANIVDNITARRTSIRQVNDPAPSLHAVISCKWTLRSDRAQNARSEALNLIRNRKGRLPHIAVVTGEPLPSRLASLAYGTGDIDCVYHVALDELVATVNALPYPDAQDNLKVMIDGRRLRDISDLPLDLAI